MQFKLPKSLLKRDEEDGSQTHSIQRADQSGRSWRDAGSRAEAAGRRNQEDNQGCQGKVEIFHKMYVYIVKYKTE